MGRYMRKAKGLKGEMAVMEVQSSPLGVRTRARTLALQRLEAASAASAAAAAAVAEDGGGSYLQLRSRRLKKLAVPSAVENGRRRKRQRKKKGNLGTPEMEKEENGENEKKVENEEGGKNGNVAGGDERVGEEEEGQQEKEDEGCFGENVLEIEGRERTTRESTPCNLITDPDNVKTPGSSTKPPRASENGGTVRNSVQRGVPTTQEMSELFDAAEEQQRKQFMDKYNFDPVKDKPLPGRFEWMKLDP